MNKERLEKVSEFLRNLPNRNFNILHLFTRTKTLDDLNNMEAVACTVGWLPKIFPDEFQWEQVDSSGFIVRRTNSYRMRLEEFFELDIATYNSLFYPSTRDYPEFQNLNSVTPMAVAIKITNLISDRN